MPLGFPEEVSLMIGSIILHTSSREGDAASQLTDIKISLDSYEIAKYEKMSVKLIDAQPSLYAPEGTYHSKTLGCTLLSMDDFKFNERWYCGQSFSGTIGVNNKTRLHQDRKF